MEDKKLNKEFNSSVIEKAKNNPINKYQNLQNQVQQEVNKVKDLRDNPKLNQKDRFDDTVIAKDKKKNIIFKLLDKLFPQKIKSNTDKREVPKEEVSAEATQRETGDFNGLTLQDVVAPIDLEVDFNSL